MNAEMPIATSIGGLLITYVVHSTLLLSAVWLTTRLLSRLPAQARALLWKTALIGGVASSLAASLAPLPRFGAEWVFATAPETIHSTPALPVAAPKTSTAGIASTADRNAPMSSVAAQPARASSDQTTLSERSWLPIGGEAALLCQAALVVWLLGATVALARIALDWVRLHQLVRRSRVLRDGHAAEFTRALAARLRLKVELNEVPGDKEVGPLAAGVLRYRIFVPQSLLQGLDREQLEALLAHEAAHLARRDPLWTLIASLVCGVLYFQPLNFLARRRLMAEAEYLADRAAVELLSNRLGLARCLASLGEWLLSNRRRPEFVPGSAGVGVASYRSSLGRRIEAILSARGEEPRARRFAWPALVGVVLMILPLAAPRATASSNAKSQTSPSEQQKQQGDPPVIKPLAAATLLAALAAPTQLTSALNADEPAAQVKVEAVPESVHGFRGQIVGQIVSKDVEKGAMVLKVQRVERVWKNNTAQSPKDCEGKTVVLDGVFGKWLDVLLLVQPGDTVQIEAKHVSGDKLQFLGENFRKVAPIKEGEGGPDKKDQPNEKDVKADGQSANEEQDGAFPEGLRGFRGILVGKMISADVEKGVLVFEMESVKRTWPKNEAKNPASAKGKQLTVTGIAGKWLDVLMSFKQGESIEIEAFHNRGDKLDFVQEWLKKAEQ